MTTCVYISGLRRFRRSPCWHIPCHHTQGFLRVITRPTGRVSRCYKRHAGHVAGPSTFIRECFSASSRVGPEDAPSASNAPITCCLLQDVLERKRSSQPEGKRGSYTDGTMCVETLCLHEILTNSAGRGSVVAPWC